MKDIVISAHALRRERTVGLCCLGVAILINLFAVIYYVRPWTEVFSQIGYTAVIAVVLYLLLWIPRLALRALGRLFRPKTQKLQ